MSQIRAVGYCRVSTDQQATADRNSLPVQEEAIKRRCEERGWEFVGLFTDVESGRKVGRSEYQRLLRGAKAGQFQVIVVTFLDRFGRDQWELMRALADLRELDVDVDAIYDDATDFIPIALSAWKAEQESRRISERVKLNQAHAAIKGVALGKPPYGYRKEGGTFVPSEPEASIVRELFDLYLNENLSIHQITRLLNARGVRATTGIRWSPTTIRDLLKRRTYLGEFRWGSVESEKPHEPLVSAEIFEAVQRRMREKSNLPAGQTQRSPFLLTGIVYCGLCGGRMVGQTSHRSSTRTTQRGYSCSDHRKYGTCIANWHEAGRVEASVLSDLAIKVSTSKQQERIAEEAIRLRRALDEVERELTRLPARFRMVQQEREKGNYASDAQYRMANQNIEDDRLSLEAERARLQEQIIFADRASDAARSVEAIIDYSASFSGLDLQARKAKLQAVIERVELSPGLAPVVYPRVLLGV